MSGIPNKRQQGGPCSAGASALVRTILPLAANGGSQDTGKTLPVGSLTKDFCDRGGLLNTARPNNFSSRRPLGASYSFGRYAGRNRPATHFIEQKATGRQTSLCAEPRGGRFRVRPIFYLTQHVSYHTPDAAKLTHVERRPRYSVAMSQRNERTFSVAQEPAPSGAKSV